jgi:hypothetical protein
LLITVVTSVSEASSPASRIASASIDQDGVAVDKFAVGIKGQAPVGVAVVRQA